MDYQKLFETQSQLDHKIVEGKQLQGIDLFKNKVEALLCEIQETANEMRESFKFWSEKKNDMDNALEETADCLHFILSLGNDLKVDISEAQRQSAIVHPDVTSQFISLTYVVSCIALHNAKERYYFQTVGLFKGLVHLLGFTEEQLEDAYYSKNEVNHTRQNNNY